ncbi:MAG: anthranilate phosphoribosyltransferase, partial [Epsilonproteobacteria bacterium]
YVVSSHDGMDEIGLAGKSAFAFVENGLVTEGEIDPEAYGFTLGPKEAIQGGDAAFNAQISRDIFSGKEQGAKRDIVVLNAAFALFANGGVKDIAEAIEKVKAQLESGKATKHLQCIAEVSKGF